jgi:hypothetical protein
MAWDPQSQRVILLGGTGGSACAVGSGGGEVTGTVTSSDGVCAQQLQDAWAWDGSDWSSLSIGHAVGQLGYYTLAGASMATDVASGRIVLVTSSTPAAEITPVDGGSGSSSGSAAPGSSATAVAVPGSAGGTCIGVDGGPCGSPVDLPSVTAVASPEPTACPLDGGCTFLPCRSLPVAQASGGSDDIACPLPCTSAVSTCVICPETSGVASPEAGTEVTCSNCPDIEAPCPLLPATYTWVFGGSSFQQAVSDPSASPQSGGHLVWFPGPNRLVDLGSDLYAEPVGSDVTCSGDVPCAPIPSAEDWAWTGSGWTPEDVFLANAASPNYEVPPIADAVAGNVVLFDDTGATWVSTAPSAGWVKASPADAPTPRSGFALAYDGDTGQVVLFGGEVLGSTSAAGGVAGDTWTWDGTDWTQRGGTAPSPTPSSSVTPVASPVELPALPPVASASAIAGTTSPVSTPVPSASASSLPAILPATG